MGPEAAAIMAGGEILGGLFGGGKLSARKQMAMQYEYQRNLNQTAIQDRVADAEKAGIHPLYALGASLNPGGVSMPDQSGSTLGDRLSNMGQNISRAMMAKQSREERAFAQRSAELDLEGKSLDNEVKRAQIASLMRDPSLPPSNGANNGRGVDYINNTLVGSGVDGREPGTVSGYTEVRNADGSSTRIPSKDWQDRSEDVPLIGWEWFARNRVLPFFQDSWKSIRNNFKNSKSRFQKGRYMRTGPLG